MNKVLDALAEQWLYDIENLSYGFMTWYVLPGLFYFAFMVIKWMILTVPLWLPICILIKAFQCNSSSSVAQNTNNSPTAAGEPKKCGSQQKNTTA